MVNQSKGVITLDTLFAVLPAILIVFYVVKSSAFIVQQNQFQMEQQEKFDKLVSVADYLVNYGLTKKENGKYHPNWIIELNQEKINKAFDASGLEKVKVGFEKGTGTCIYRIITYGEQKEIKKLYFCTGEVSI